MNSNNSAVEIETAVKLSVDAWLLSNRRMNTLVRNLTDKELYSHVAPGKNRGVYLLGHLASINDAMLVLLGFSDRLYPHLEPLFVSNPDNIYEQYPSIEELKESWCTVNYTLLGYIEKMQPGQWLEKHTAVSDRDFESDPLRNKLSILISRTNHQNYHLGQLTFLL